MKDDLYRKIHGNMIFPVYMYKCYGYGTTVLPKKLRWSCPEKIHLKVSLPASLKKMIFILENMVFLLKCYIDWHSRKSPRSPRVTFFFNLYSWRYSNLRIFEIYESSTLLKRDSGAGVFYRTPLGGCFWSDSLLFYGDFYRRFYVLLSGVKKAGNLIYRIEIWLLLQVI